MLTARASAVAALLVAALGSVGNSPANAATTSVLPLPPIVSGIDVGGGPWIVANEYNGRPLTGFLAYFDFSLGGLNVATGDLTGDGRAKIVTAPGLGGRAELRSFDQSGVPVGPSVWAGLSGGGMRVAVGDVNGDGKDEIVAGNDRGGGPNVQVFDALTGTQLSFFGAFSDPTGHYGARVATGDVNGDGRDEVIVGSTDASLDPRVRIFSALPSTFFPPVLRTISQFGATTLKGGEEVASADLNADGRDEVIVGVSRLTGASELKVFDGASGAILSSFVVFGQVAADTLRVASGDLDGDGKPEIVASADTPAGALIRAFTPSGLQLFELTGISASESLSVGDVDGDGIEEIVAAAGPGDAPRVTILEQRAPGRAFQAYPSSFTNGVRVAVGDLDGDGQFEYVTGQGARGQSELAIFEARDGALSERLTPFQGSSNGIFVAVGDLNGDRAAEVVVGADEGGEPQVKTFDVHGHELASFLAFDRSFRGGVRVGTSDLDGDGRSEILAASGPGMPPQVRVFDATGTLKLAFAPPGASTGGLFVSGGDTSGDGHGEIVVGSGVGTAPIVRVFDGNGQLRTSFVAYEGGFDGGVRVAVSDVDRDGAGEILTAPGREHAVDVKVFTEHGRLLDTYRVNPFFRGGIFVGAPPSMGPALQPFLTGGSNAVEGRRMRIGVAMFTDPATITIPEDFATTIKWGDGATSEGIVVVLPDGRLAVTGEHRYRRGGEFQATVGISDRFMRGLVLTTPVLVDYAALRGRGSTLVTDRRRAVAGTVATFHDENSVSVPGDFRATVVWGDGTRSDGTVKRDGRRYIVVARHRYAASGRFLVSVRIRGLDGQKLTLKGTARTP